MRNAIKTLIFSIFVLSIVSTVNANPFACQGDVAKYARAFAIKRGAGENPIDKVYDLTIVNDEVVAMTLTSINTTNGETTLRTVVAPNGIEDTASHQVFGADQEMAAGAAIQIAVMRVVGEDNFDLNDLQTCMDKISNDVEKMNNDQ